MSAQSRHTVVHIPLIVSDIFWRIKRASKRFYCERVPLTQIYCARQRPRRCRSGKLKKTACNLLAMLVISPGSHRTNQKKKSNFTNCVRESLARIRTAIAIKQRLFVRCFTKKNWAKLQPNEMHRNKKYPANDDQATYTRTRTQTSATPFG